MGSKQRKTKKKKVLKNKKILSIISLILIIGTVVILLAKENEWLIFKQEEKNDDVVVDNTGDTNKKEDSKLDVSLDKIEDKQNSPTENINKENNVEVEKNEKEEVKVDISKIKQQLLKNMAEGLDIESLPEVTLDERERYENEWKSFVSQEKMNVANDIKKAYPDILDDEAEKYAIKIFDAVKEDALKVAKYNQEIIDKAKDAIAAVDKANAMSELTLKYTEVLMQYMQINPGTSYVANDEDLKVLQQHVMEKTDNKYTVKISNSDVKYEVVEND